MVERFRSLHLIAYNSSNIKHILNVDNPVNRSTTQILLRKLSTNSDQQFLYKIRFFDFKTFDQFCGSISKKRIYLN